MPCIHGKSRLLVYEAIPVSVRLLSLGGGGLVITRSRSASHEVYIEMISFGTATVGVTMGSTLIVQH